MIARKACVTSLLAFKEARRSFHDVDAANGGGQGAGERRWLRGSKAANQLGSAWLARPEARWGPEMMDVKVDHLLGSRTPLTPLII